MVLLWCEKIEILPKVFRILREVLFTGGNVALDWAELGTLLETLFNPLFTGDAVLLEKTDVETTTLVASPVKLEKMDSNWVSKPLGVTVSVLDVPVRDAGITEALALITRLELRESEDLPPTTMDETVLRVCRLVVVILKLVSENTVLDFAVVFWLC